MNEYMIGITAVGSLIGLAVGCLFYMFGGRANKWLRRFIGSLIIATTVNLSAYFMGNWSYWLTLIYPCLIGGFCQGYGGTTLEQKIVRRLLFALAVCSAGLVCCVVLGGNAWWILPIHVGAGLFTVFLGIVSKVNAAAEEVFVCALLNIGLIIYPFVT